MNETYVEINLDNIKHNIKTILKKYNNYKYYIAVLKANAYGCGEYIVNELVDNGINYIAVATIDEALNVRKYNKDIPILLLEPINIDSLKIAIKNNLTLTIHNLNYLKELINIVKQNIKVHIKIDSGLGRLGIDSKEELKKVYDIIKKNKHIELEGIYSHFATIGVFDKKWDNQVNNFKNITSLINLKDIPIRHMGSSISLLTHPKIDFCNATRFGTILYGYDIGYKINNVGLKNKLRILRNNFYKKKYKISDTYINVDIDLLPCMSLYTSILEIKHIKEDNFIGYGAHIEAHKDMYIGIISIGYNNGIGTNNNGYVYINDKKYKILSVGMNMSYIEVDDKVNINDKVILLDNKNITIGSLARVANRTFHEMLLNIGKSNTIKYIKDNKVIYVDKK